MRASKAFSLPKEERIRSRKLAEELFSGKGSRAMSAFPLRVVYKVVSQADAGIHTAMLASVSKRHFKQAVKRNRAKRQIREAYRLRKHTLTDKMADKDGILLLAFIWLSDEPHTSQEVSDSMKCLLDRIAETL